MNVDDLPPDSAAMRERWLNHALEAFKGVEHARHYAIDDVTVTGLGALLAVWQRQRGESYTRAAGKQFIADFCRFAPNLLQERPSPEPEPLKLPVDPVTGATPANPWQKGPGFNLSEQAFLAANHPALAEHLKATADGVSYTELFKRKAEAEKREIVRGIKYGSDEHKTNPFFSATDNLTARSTFVKTHDPATVAFWKREAITGAELPWRGSRNLTAMGRLTRDAPELRKLVDEAAALEKVWAKDQLSSLGDDEKRLAQHRATAEKLLAAK